MSSQVIVGAVGPSACPPHRLFSGPATRSFQTAPAYLATEEMDCTTPESVCVLDGYIYEPERLAARLGVPVPANDAHLLASAYRAWGDAMLDTVQGEFAFAVWRPDKRCGLIARDRSGARPMFYASTGRQLYFASEVNDLLAMLPRRPDPDDVVVSWALSSWFVHGDRTLFAGVRRLESGTALRLGVGGFSPVRFWRPQPCEPPALGRDEAVTRIKDLVEAAVARQVRDGDDPAIQLSGGLDSGAVAALSMVGLGARGKALRAYSAVFPGFPETDESAQLDSLADSLGLAQVRLSFKSGSPLRAAMRFLERWGMPVGSPNFFVWEQLLQRAAREGVSVMLDGNGGDELFGVSPYLLADRLRHGSLLGAARLAKRIPGAGSGRRDVARSLSRWGVEGLLPAWFGDRREAADPPLLTGAARQWFRDGQEHDTWRRSHGPRWWAAKAHHVTRGFEAMGFNDYSRRAVESAGIVSRHPLLDPDLVDFVLSLPPEWSFDPLLTRPLLREAAAGALPDAIRLRRGKADFARVFTVSLREQDLPTIRRLIGSNRSECLRYVDRSSVERELLDGPSHNPRGEFAWALETWRIANVEMWLRMQTDPTSPADILRLDEIHEGAASHFLPP